MLLAYYDEREILLLCASVLNNNTTLPVRCDEQ